MALLAGVRPRDWKGIFVAIESFPQAESCVFSLAGERKALVVGRGTSVGFHLKGETWGTGRDGDTAAEG